MTNDEWQVGRSEGAGEVAQGEPLGMGGLKREDWDFSRVPAEELMPALAWEMYRECDCPHCDMGRTEAFGADVSLLVRAFARPWLCLPEELRWLLVGCHEDWQARQILRATAGILKRLRPASAKQVTLRGRKRRDIMAALERVGIMRLLHHYTLSEIKRALPDAWRIYQHRKWYDDRRRALKDFRRIVQAKGTEQAFPRSWKTKGCCELPGK